MPSRPAASGAVNISASSVSSPGLGKARARELLQFDRELVERNLWFGKARPQVPFLTLGRHRAIQSEPRSPSSHPEAQRRYPRARAIRVNWLEFYGLATVFRQNVRNDRAKHVPIAGQQQQRCGALAAGQRNALSRVGRMAARGRTKMPAPQSAAGIAGPREAVRAQSGAISTPDAAGARSMIGETPEWTLWAIVGLFERRGSFRHHDSQ